MATERTNVGQMWKNARKETLNEKNRERKEDKIDKIKRKREIKINS